MGSAPIIRMLVIFGVVGITFTALAGFLVWKQSFAPAEWRPVDSPRGGYKVEYPAAPLTDIEKRMGFLPTPGGTYEGTVHRRVEYAVVWGEIPGGRNPWATDEDLIAASIDDMRGAVPDGQFELREPTKVGVFNAREVVLSKAGDRTYVAKIVVADTRFFMLIAGGRTSTADNPDVRRFLDSFEITDTRLANASKTREQQVKQARIAEEKRQEDLRQRREAELKREEELRLAEIQARELAEKKRLHGILVADQNEEFLKAAPLDGVTAPEPGDFAKSLDEVFPFRLDERKSDGVWLADIERPGTGSDFIRQATSGSGVRANAAYLRQGNTPASFGNSEAERFALKRVFDNSAGYTLSGWVRTRTLGVEVFRGENALGTVVELTLGRATVSATIFAHQNPTELSFPWTADEKWHHVALVREQTPSGGVARLYFDGKMVAAGATKAPLQLPATLKIGGLSSKESEATKVPDFEGKPADPAVESLVGAIDDCCLIARPLASDEVQSLAGRSPPPASPQAVKLTAGKQLGAITGLGFDPHRKAVWVVTGNQPPRFPPFMGGEIQKAPPAPASRLLKLSYPGFEELANYQLPGTAIAVAFDQPRNRLFVTVAPPGGKYPASSQDWPATDLGTLQRFDLDILPANGKQLVADAEASEKFAVRAMAVSPNGATVYFTGCDVKTVRGRGIGGTDAYDNRLYRVGDSLDGVAEQFPNNVTISCASHFELSSDGKTLSLFRPAPKGGGGSELLEIDAERWNIRDGVISYIFPTDWVSVNESRYFVCTGGGEHSLDVHAMTRVKNASSFSGIGTTGRQFLGILAGGRLLITSGADPTYLRRDPQKLNTLRVYESSGKGAQRSKPWKPLAELPESTEVLVGGPFWVAPDGRAIVFRSGQVVNVESGADIAPRPIPPPSENPAPRPASIARAPRPRERLPERVPTDIGIKTKYTGGKVPAATELKGLVWYLPLNGSDNGKVTEVVSGKQIGTLTPNAAEVIEGPRGNALRLTAPEPEFNTTSVALEFTDQGEVFRIPSNKPFTFSVWVRAENAGKGTTRNVFSSSLPGARHAGLDLTLYVSQAVGMVRSAGPVRNVSVAPLLPPEEEWFHFALVRTPTGRIQAYLNGVASPHDPNAGRCAGEMRCDTIGLVTTKKKPVTLGVAEVCLFDRILEDEEIEALAGKRAVPKSKPAAALAAIPAATDFKGLKVHLAFDEVKDGAVRETVSNNFFGKSTKLELVDGRRGKAARLTTERNVVDSTPTPGALDLSDLVSKFNIPAGNPFTVTLWFREVSRDGNYGAFHLPFVMDSLPNKDKPGEFYVLTGLGELRFNLRDQPPKGPPGQLRGPIGDSECNCGEWAHLTIGRDEQNVVRWWLNGTRAEPLKGNVRWEGPLNYTRWVVGGAGMGKLVMDVDEFCLFDRMLDETEIGALAGIKPAPKVKDPADTAIVPKPKGGLPAYAGEPVPSATEIKGLQLYLPLDEQKDGKVKEHVSGKWVGSMAAGEVVSGPRGKALRVTHDPAKAKDTPAINLPELVDSVAIPAGTPFTMSVWARVVSSDVTQNPAIIHARQYGQKNTQIRLSLGRLGGHATATGSEGSCSLSGGVGGLSPDGGIWHHLALVREGNGLTRLLVDGVDLEIIGTSPGFGGAGVCRGAITPTSFGLVFNEFRKDVVVVDVAEFCLFNRALGYDDVRKLAGIANPAPKGFYTGLQDFTGRVPPPATDFKGLTFYLPFDDAKPTELDDVVSRKPLTVPDTLTRVDGPRGKAGRIRILQPRPPLGYKETTGLPLPPEAIRFSADKPFTIAFWVRLDIGSSCGFLSGSSDGGSLWVSPLEVGLRHQSDRNILPANQPRISLSHSEGGFQRGEWIHLAITRDSLGNVRAWSNGVNRADLGGGKFPHPLEYRSLGLGVMKGVVVVDVDEFCVFNRDLTSDEIGALAGLKPAAKRKDSDLAPAPMPRRQVGRYTGGSVPAATELKGLIWYLPLNDFRPQGFDGGAVAEAVSGKHVGSLGRTAPEVINGPRGRALQLTAPFAEPGTTSVALDLSGHGDVLRFPAGKPFTVAVWLRNEKVFDAVNHIRDVFSGSPKEGDAGSFSLTLQEGGVFSYLRGKKPNSGTSGDAALPPEGEWYHLAVVRTPTGRVRVFLNGSAKPLPTGPALRFTDEVRCDVAHLVSTRRGEFSLGVAELCVFDRILDDEEVEALAGKRPVPKPKQPEQLLSIPPATDIKGLKVYLAFNEVKDGTVKETVSGKFFGKGTALELVDGPRGKAIRLVSERPENFKGASPPGLDLADLAPKIDFAANQPFTLTIWMREVSRDPMNGFSNTPLRLESGAERAYSRSFHMNMGRGQLFAGAGHSPVRGNFTNSEGVGMSSGWKPTEWTHVAVLRDEKSTVRWFINGKPGPAVVNKEGKEPIWGGPGGYDSFVMCTSIKGKTVMELDEFCFFDRALDESEVKALAGQPEKK